MSMSSFFQFLWGKKKSSSVDVDSVDKIDGAPSSVQEGQLAVDIYHTDDEIVVIAPLAGVDEKNISVAVDDDVLTIKGERYSPEAPEAAEYYVQECFWGAFSRSVILPFSASPDLVEATYKDGVLTVLIPKDSEPKKRMVKVKSVK